MHSSSPDSWLSLARFELPTIEHPVNVRFHRVPSFHATKSFRDGSSVGGDPVFKHGTKPTGHGSAVRQILNAAG